MVVAQRVSRPFRSDLGHATSTLGLHLFKYKTKLDLMIRVIHSPPRLSDYMILCLNVLISEAQRQRKRLSYNPHAAPQVMECQNISCACPFIRASRHLLNILLSACYLLSTKARAVNKTAVIPALRALLELTVQQRRQTLTNTAAYIIQSAIMKVDVLHECYNEGEGRCFPWGRQRKISLRTYFENEI